MKNEIFAIWLCKPGTYMMPYLYEMCICTWQVLNPNYKVVIYTNEVDLKFNFLSKDTTEVRLIDEYFPNLIKEAEEIIGDDVPEGMRFAHRSDYIRYVIVSTRLGIYIDADLLCVSSIEEFMEQCKKEGKYVIMAKEDNIRIGNAFMTCLDEKGKEYYNDILQNYRTNYIKTSYTFNSIKYPMLINHRYNNIVKVLDMKDGFFYPNWEIDGPNGDLDMLKSTKCQLNGYGVHLYNSDHKWKEFRQQLEQELFQLDHPWWIQQHFNKCITEYIGLMKNSEQRMLNEKERLYDSIVTNYGQDYANNFKEEK